MDFLHEFGDYIRFRSLLAAFPKESKQLDLTVAGSFEVEAPGNLIFVTKAVATDMDDFEIRVRYNNPLSLPVFITQVMTFGFNWERLFVEWDAVVGGAANIVFGTEY